MITILFILAPILYAMIAGFTVGRMEAIANKTCHYKSTDHFKGTWCGHSVSSFWTGAFWPIGLPIKVGLLAGASSSESRREKKQQRELDQERHEAEKARVRALAAENLTRELRALGKDV